MSMQKIPITVEHWENKYITGNTCASLHWQRHVHKLYQVELSHWLSINSPGDACAGFCTVNMCSAVVLCKVVGLMI